jgi:hypothetical protein
MLCILVQVTSNYIRLFLVRSFCVVFSQVRSDYVRLGHFMSD